MLDLPRAADIELCDLDDSESYFVETKANGHRLIGQRGVAYRRGFKRNEFDWLPLSIQQQLNRFTGSEWIDGELVCMETATREYQPASAVATMLSKRADSSQFSLQLLGFRVAGLPLRPYEHIDELQRRDCNTVQFIGEHSGAFIKENWLHQLDVWTRPFFEGIVLKLDTVESQWYKLKLSHTVDVIVTGFEPGDGKYYGLVGSIRGFTLDGQWRKVKCSGMDDEVRFALSDKDAFRVMEVEFQSIGAGNRLLCPRFIRWRADDELSQEVLALRNAYATAK